MIEFHSISHFINSFDSTTTMLTNQLESFRSASAKAKIMKLPYKL